MLDDITCSRRNNKFFFEFEDGSSREASLSEVMQWMMLGELKTMNFQLSNIEIYTRRTALRE